MEMIANTQWNLKMQTLLEPKESVEQRCPDCKGLIHNTET